MGPSNRLSLTTLLFTVDRKQTCSSPTFLHTSPWELLRANEALLDHASLPQSGVFKRPKLCSRLGVVIFRGFDTTNSLLPVIEISYPPRNNLKKQNKKSKKKKLLRVHLPFLLPIVITQDSITVELSNILPIVNVNFERWRSCNQPNILSFGNRGRQNLADNREGEKREKGCHFETQYVKISNILLRALDESAVLCCGWTCLGIMV